MGVTVHSVGLAFLIVAAVVVVSAFLLAAIPRQIEWKPTEKPLKERWIAPAALAAACAVLATVGGTFYSSSSSASQQNVQAHGQSSVAKPDIVTIRFSDPTVTAQDPLPTVSCQDDVDVEVVVGDLPADDRIVIGNGLQGSGNIAFVSDAIQTAHDTWQAHIYVGQRKDKGKLFDLYVMTMPSAWANYLRGLSNWYAPGLLPSPAQLQQSETVQRSATSTIGCQS
jgi:hypothetical protein